MVTKNYNKRYRTKKREKYHVISANHETKQLSQSAFFPVSINTLTDGLIKGQDYSFRAGT
jgi:hypothetical protein